MNIPSITLAPLLGLGAILSGCSCGTYKPEAGKSADRSSTSPVGTFSNSATGLKQVKCDAKRNCTLTFKDQFDESLTWTVDFSLDSSETTTCYPRRDL